jgi:hypothetical protein
MRILVLLFVSVLLPSLKATTISVTPSTSTAVRGETITAAINIFDVADLYAFQFDLLFGPDVLVASEVSDGHFLDTGGFFAGFIDNTVGMITFISDTLSGPVVGKSGSGVLAQIRLTATGPGTSALTIANPILLDSNLSSLPVQLVNSQIAVADSDSQVPEPATGLIAGLVLCGIVFSRIRALGVA